MLGVLDGAVLVVSAVEGVQAQTRVLMRTLQRLRIPTLIFVNKIDRARRRRRARCCATSPSRLTPGDRRDGGGRATWAPAAPRSRRTAPADAGVHRAGSPSCSPSTTTRCWPRTSTTRRPCRTGRLRRGAGRADRAGAGAPGVLRLGDHRRRRRRADRRHRRAAAGGRRRRRTARSSGTVFKVERGPAGREGRLRADVLRHACGSATGCAFGPRTASGKVTAISVFERGAAVPRAVGRGRADRQALGARRRPDRRRDRRAARAGRPRAPVRAADAGDRRRRRAGRPTGARCTPRSTQLAEQDPLINLRQDDVRQEMLVSLYGEVQKEVIQATLADRLRHRGRLPRDDDDLHRAAGRHRRGGRVHRHGAEPVPGHRRAARRARPGRRRRRRSGWRSSSASMPLAFFKAVEETVRGDAAAGPARLAGHRLRGDA